MSSYRYRPHLRWVRNVVTWVLIGFGVAIIAIAAASRFFWVGGMIGVILIGEGFLLRYLLGRFIQVEVSTDDTAILYRSRGKEIQLPYHAITKLNFPSAKYLGGWVKISSETDSIRLTVVIENIADFLRELKSGLDKHSKTLIYDEKKFFDFFKTSAYSDQSWERVYEIFWRLLGAHFLLFFMGVLVTAIIGAGASFPLYIFMGILSSLWAMGVYLVGEARFAQRVEQQASSTDFSYPPRDKEFETSVYKKGAAFGSIAYCVVIPLLILLLKGS